MSEFLRNAHFFLQNISWRDVLDVLVVGLLLYQLLKLIRGTQAVQLLVGLAVIFVIGYFAQVLQLRLRLLILKLRARQVRLRGARSERIVDLHAGGPVRVLVLEHVAQHRAEAASRDHIVPTED